MLTYDSNLEKVRFLNGFPCATIHEIMEGAMIQEGLSDDTENALYHLIDFSDDVEIRFPIDCTQQVAETYIEHFNVCLDPILQESADLYENWIISTFEETILPSIVNAYEQDGVRDIPARREAYNNYVDSLEKDGSIPSRVADNTCLPDRFE